MEGWQFAAELSHLRVVGRIDLPALISTYAFQEAEERFSRSAPPPVVIKGRDA